MVPVDPDPSKALYPWKRSTPLTLGTGMIATRLAHKALSLIFDSIIYP